MIEPIQMSTAIIASVTTPIVLDRALHMRPLWAWLGSVVIANVMIEVVFRLLRPDFHYGPLFGLAVVMYIVITSIVVGFVLTILVTYKNAPAQRIKRGDDR